MMEFYKKRDFGELISDTFQFFKIYGKNYFKNYFLINGLLLLLLAVIFVFGYREFFMQLFAGNSGGEAYYFERYFEDNIGVLVLVVVSIFVLFVAVSIISYSYPIFYLNRVSKNNIKTVKSDEILADIKNNLGRIFILMLGLTFVITPAFVILLGVSAALVLVVIGFFLLLLLLPTCVNVVYFLMYDYLQNKKGFFESLSFAIRAQFSYNHQNQKSPFWKYWGTTIVIYIIIYIVNSIFTMIPYLIYFGGLYTIPSGSQGFETNPFVGTMGVFLFLIYGISVLVSFIMMNVLLVANGLMYYDNRTDLHQQMDILEIDSIGSRDEV